MRSAFALVAFSAVALAQSTVTPVAVDNPATQYLTETNSLGVVTGQPDAVTSQPAAVTSQPGAASIPAGLTTPVVVPTPTTTTSIGETTGPVSSGTTQTGFTTTASASASGSDTASESGSSASGTGTGTGTASGSAASSTGTGAAAPGATAGPVGLSLVAGAAIAMLL